MINIKFNRNIPSPQYNNSAGRLLNLLMLVNSSGNYSDIYSSLYIGYSFDTNTNNDDEIGYTLHQNNLKKDVKYRREFRAKCYHDFFSRLTDALNIFLQDLENSETIANETKNVITNSLKDLIQLIYYDNQDANKRILTEAEQGMLKMAGTLLPIEPIVEKSEIEQLQSMLDELFNYVKSTDLPKSVKINLLEILKLAKDAIDYYNIYGARGFKKAYKKSIAELYELHHDNGDEVKDQPYWKVAEKILLKIDYIASRALVYAPYISQFSPVITGFIK